MHSIHKCGKTVTGSPYIGFRAPSGYNSFTFSISHRLLALKLRDTSEDLWEEPPRVTPTGIHSHCSPVGSRVFSVSCFQMSFLQVSFWQPKARPKKPGGHCPPGSMFQFHSVHSLFFSRVTSWSVAISIRWPPLSWSSSRSGSADGLSFLLSAPTQAQ